MPLDLRLYALRHTFATLWLESGEHPKILQEILGHSRIHTTLDVYSHALPHMQREAMERFGARFRILPESRSGNALTSNASIKSSIHEAPAKSRIFGDLRGLLSGELALLGDQASQPGEAGVALRLFPQRALGVDVPVEGLAVVAEAPV